MENNRIAILASGSGSNAEAIIQFLKGDPDMRVSIVLTNNPTAGVLARCERLGVEARVFSREDWKNGSVLKDLQARGITHIVLAGFLWLLPPTMVQAYPNRIVNIHPSLLPKFGGKGMYGHHVHEAVRKSGDTITGMTIHLVNEKFDDGKVLFQATCEVSPSDTPDDIARKVNKLELRHYPEVVRQWILSR